MFFIKLLVVKIGMRSLSREFFLKTVEEEVNFSRCWYSMEIFCLNILSIEFKLVFIFKFGDFC